MLLDDKCVNQLKNEKALKTENGTIKFVYDAIAWDLTDSPDKQDNVNKNKQRNPKFIFTM